MRIQNRCLYEQYQLEKRRVEQGLYPGQKAELQLWHGTDKTAVFEICESKFNRSFAGKNGEQL